MPKESDKLTPMLAQYQSIKKNYPDALLFYRMGDFYELFFEDALIASRELQIALTSRGKGENSPPMCGVPWHAAQSYVARLIDKGYNVAICEQVEDPRASKGLVRREVTGVITPGTALDESGLGAKNHNYLGAVFCGLRDSSAFAWADVSTGQWSGVEFHRQADLWQWVRKLAPRELLLADGQHPPSGFIQEGIRLVYQPTVNFELRRATERVLAAQGVADTASLGLDGKPALIRACGALISYLEQTQIRQPNHLLPFRPLDLGRRLIIDDLTERNLEIFIRQNGRKGKGTLRHVIDATVTPMGGRLLEDMLRQPWRDPKAIRRIQDCVAYLRDHDDKRGSLREALESVYDLERLIIRICLCRASQRDFMALRQSLAGLPAIRAVLQSGEEPPQSIQTPLAGMDELSDCAELLGNALADDATETSGEKGIFRRGFNAELDAQLDLLEHGEQKLRDFLELERAKSGIAKLKLGYNRVFGYYLEAPRSALQNGLPEHFIRRQSLANVERFTSEDLKKLENDLLLASDRRDKLETEMLENLRAHLAAQKERVLQTADVIANLDYWQSLAEVGKQNEWVIPEITQECEIHIQAGRHPVVESIIGRPNFVANDFHMDISRRLCLLTGPNMAGKSTILRQVALICILAQMGGMVPASTARLGIVDRLFSRVGAADNLAQGQSTFMVEMMETARILRQAGKRSLIILDEIGRGTSTYDGMALAQAVVEDLSGRCQGQLRVLFATHYHELTALENRIPGLFNMNVAVGAFENNEILFLHRLLPGPADRSYGVEVARLAGVPYPVVQRARDLLKNLEQSRARQAQAALTLPGMDKGGKRGNSPGADLLRELKNLNLEHLSPPDALAILVKWQKIWTSGQEE